MNFNVLEKFISGGLYTGHWVVFNEPQNIKMLTFLANQLMNVRQTLLDTSFDKGKASLPGLNNIAFFLLSDLRQPCRLDQLLAPFEHR